MSRLFSWFYLLPRLLHTLFSRPGTVRYPFAPLQLPERFRGRLTIRAEDCRGCGLCVRDCPAAALELHKQGRSRFTLLYHPDRCAYCGQCELSCHHGAIQQVNEFVPATTTRVGLTETLVDRNDGA